MNKVPYFITYFSYEEAWGFDVYCPKTIEILIKFYNENSSILMKNEFRIKDNPLIFQLLLNNYFVDSSNEERDKFIEHCAKQI